MKLPSSTTSFWAFTIGLFLGGMLCSIVGTLQFSKAPYFDFVDTFERVGWNVCIYIILCVVFLLLPVAIVSVIAKSRKNHTALGVVWLTGLFYIPPLIYLVTWLIPHSGGGFNGWEWFTITSHFAWLSFITDPVAFIDDISLRPVHAFFALMVMLTPLLALIFGLLALAKSKDKQDK